MQKSSTVNIQLCSKNTFGACKEKKQIILYDFL